MKQLKKVMGLLIAAMMIVTLSGCAALMNALEDKDIRFYTETMLDALIAEDVDAAYTAVSSISDRDSFEAAFGEMKRLIGDVESYELQLLSIKWNTRLENGGKVKTADAVYRMTTDAATYVITVQTMSLYEKLSAFYIIPYEQTNYYYTGTIDTMQNASPLQWIVLLSNLLVIGLVVWATVDCFRHPVKLKALWVVIILLGFITLGVTMGSSEFRFNFDLGWLFKYSAYILYGGGLVDVHFMLPIGSLVYFVLRKPLMKKPLPAPEIAPILTEESPFDNNENPS